MVTLGLEVNVAKLYVCVDAHPTRPFGGPVHGVATRCVARGALALGGPGACAQRNGGMSGFGLRLRRRLRRRLDVGVSRAQRLRE